MNTLTKIDEKGKLSVKALMNNEYTMSRFKDVMGEKAAGFVASVLSVVSNNSLLSKADPMTVMNAAMTAATLDLPINPNLGFAYIVPYKGQAQFQMGYKGFVQLAMRSGQFRTINVSDVRQGEIESIDRLTGEICFAWLSDKDRTSTPVVGFVAYMELINGFRKSMFMTSEELKKHGMKFSQSAKRGGGLWNEDFDSMAKKTVIKLLLSKYAPLSTQMQTATLADQAVVKDDGFEYVDNEPMDVREVAAEKERARIVSHIENSKTVEELDQCVEALESQDEEVGQMYEAKLNLLMKQEVK